MKKDYKLILFDLDGTLADTSEGIMNCCKQTLLKIGYGEPGEKELKKAVGAKLIKTFMNVFGLDEKTALECVVLYRMQYAIQGIFEAVLYEDMKQTLQALKTKGYKLAVATLKEERLANMLLENLGIADCFEVIHGSNKKDDISKSDIINMCINDLDAKTEDCVLVGDSMTDLKGAKQSNIDFIAVTYGFGFQSYEEKQMINKTLTASKPLQLLDLL